ncbi:P-type conjugative transfer protein TrbJ [Brevundimonas vesicularis]|uniref:conjugal transfer protein TrbJ n=1 Tax=Brevundimonas vesicularis TaxID=41276 RepID=UPI00278A8681|nr:conjugal transfer protein TrbJ [Brevundimonas vesicularis]MDQ1193894.1 P-type conjugative transfer protein TrbJ [Brevundimonas vesicularis]
MSTRSSTASVQSPHEMLRPNRRRWLGGLIGVALAAVAATPLPARAQLAVYDARADIRAVLSAARQAESLANEARTLANQARSLAASPYSHLAETSETLRDIGELARSVRGTASTLQGVQRQFSDLYPDDMSVADLTRLGAGRSATARRTAEDLARTAAELERLAQSRDGRLRGALAASAAAEGETAAIQSSAQMLSVLAEDLASMRTVLLAQSRLMAEGAARQAADREAAIEARRRFWARGAFTPAAPTFNPLTHARD